MSDDTETVQRNVIAKLLLPVVPLLVTFAVAFGGMRWAIGSLERQMTSADRQTADACVARDAATTQRLATFEARQIDVIARLSRVEALLGQHTGEKPR